VEIRGRAIAQMRTESAGRTVGSKDDCRKHTIGAARRPPAAKTMAMSDQGKRKEMYATYIFIMTCLNAVPSTVTFLGSSSWPAMSPMQCHQIRCPSSIHQLAPRNTCAGRSKHLSIPDQTAQKEKDMQICSEHTVQPATAQVRHDRFKFKI